VPGRLKLVRRQAEVAERRPERLACIGSVQELLSHLYWEPRLRPASKACRSCIVLRFPALVGFERFRRAFRPGQCRRNAF
jgi:hypothetical protein